MFEKKYVVYITYRVNGLKEELGRFRTRRGADNFLIQKNIELGDIGTISIEKEN